MALSNFQYLWNGLTVGAGTDVQIVQEQGLRSLPPVRSQNINKPRMDGAFPGLNFFGERTAVLTLAVSVTKNAPFETVVANVTNAFQPTYDPNAEAWLQFQYPGYATPRQIKCRVTKAGFTTDLDYSFHKLGSMPIEFVASDPLIYDSVNSNASVHLASSGIYPLTTLGANVSAAGTALTVASATGIIAGMTVYIDVPSSVFAGANLTTAASSSATVLKVNSAAGFVAGQTIYIGTASPETKVISSITGPTANATTGLPEWTINLTTGLTTSRAIGVNVTNAEVRTVASVVGTTVNLTAGVQTGHSTGAVILGSTFPAVFPVSYAPTSGGALLTNNAGNYPTWPTFTLTGPLTNPTVTLQSTGEFFSLNTTLTASDTIVIDMKAGTVILNGSTTRYNTVVTGSSWFYLPVGAGTVKVSSTSASYEAGLFTIDYRSAWSWS